MRRTSHARVMAALLATSMTLGMGGMPVVGVAGAEESAPQDIAVAAEEAPAVASDATPEAPANTPENTGEVAGEATEASQPALVAESGEEHVHGDVVFTPWTGTDSLPSTAGNYYLVNNVTLSGSWSTPAGTTNLCLAGKTIVGGESESSLIAVGEGTTLNLYDEAGGAIVSNGSEGTGIDVEGGATCNMYGGTVAGFKNGIMTNLQSKDETHPSALFGAFTLYDGVIRDNFVCGVYVFSGSFTMNGGHVINNGTDIDGGGVYVNYSDFTMNGGEISGNKGANGGGVYLFRSGDVYVNGGTIANNVAAGDGGGFYLDGATLNMSGGTIANNVAAGNGGGVFEVNRFDNGVISQYNLLGGSVTGNVAGKDGGIYVTDGSALSVAGAPRVTSNAGGGVSNIYLPGNTLNVVGPLASGASLGITHVNADGAIDHGAFTKGYKESGNTADPSSFFFADNTGAVVAWTEDGAEARLISGYSITVNTTINGTVTASKTTATPGETITLTVTPSSGYVLSTLSVMDSSFKAVPVVNNTFTMPEGNVSVTATFRSSSTAAYVSRTTTSSTRTSSALANTADPTSLAAAGMAAAAGISVVMAGTRKKR